MDGNQEFIVNGGESHQDVQKLVKTVRSLWTNQGKDAKNKKGKNVGWKNRQLANYLSI